MTLKAREIIGWRELVALPDLGIAELAAKIDTGALTSALHAENQEVFLRDGVEWVGFTAPGKGPARRVELPVRDRRAIKNTSGRPEDRLIVAAMMIMGRHRWRIDLSLADRTQMEFDLIVGRRALRARGIVVDPAHSYLLGPPTGPIAKRSQPRQEKAQ